MATLLIYFTFSCLCLFGPTRHKNHVVRSVISEENVCIYLFIHLFKCLSVWLLLQIETAIAEGGKKGSKKIRKSENQKQNGGRPSNMSPQCVVAGATVGRVVHECAGPGAVQLAIRQRQSPLDALAAAVRQLPALLVRQRARSHVRGAGGHARLRHLRSVSQRTVPGRRSRRRMGPERKGSFPGRFRASFLFPAPPSFVSFIRPVPFPLA